MSRQYIELRNERKRCRLLAFACFRELISSWDSLTSEEVMIKMENYFRIMIW